MRFPSLLISLDKLIRAHVFHQSHVHTCTRNDFPVGDTATVSLPGRLSLPKCLGLRASSNTNGSSLRLRHVDPDLCTRWWLKVACIVSYDSVVDSGSGKIV